MTDVSITTPSGGESAAATRQSPEAGVERPVFRPRVDLLDREQEVLLFADMPGSRADDIEIHFENGLLTVRGRVADRSVRGVRHLVREYGLGDFERSFTLGEQIDTAGIEASFAQGVLTVRLPKLGQAQPRRIEVRAG